MMGHLTYSSLSKGKITKIYSYLLTADISSHACIVLKIYHDIKVGTKPNCTTNLCMSFMTDT